MAKTSKAGVMDSKKGSKMKVEGEEAALPANVAAPSKIRRYITVAAITLAVLCFCTSLMNLVLPYAVSDPCEWQEVRLVCGWCVWL